MNPNAMMIGWNRAVSGREAAAGELFQQMMGYFGKLQAEGVIESFEPTILALHGGDLNGFTMVRGKPESLAKVRHSDEFVALIMACGVAIEGFGVIDGYQGDALMQVMSKWGEIVAKG